MAKKPNFNKIGINLLSASRIIGAPFIIFSLLPKISSLATTIINPLLSIIVGVVVPPLIIGAFLVTDFFDGYWARKTNNQTKLGQILDPIADKVLGILLAIYLVSLSPAFLLLIAGESAIALTSIFKNDSLRTKPSHIGKAKEVPLALSLVIGMVLSNIPGLSLAGALPHILSTIAVLPTTWFQYQTFKSYADPSKKVVKQQEEQELKEESKGRKVTNITKITDQTMLDKFNQFLIKLLGPEEELKTDEDVLYVRKNLLRLAKQKGLLLKKKRWGEIKLALLNTEHWLANADKSLAQTIVHYIDSNTGQSYELSELTTKLVAERKELQYTKEVK